MGSSGGIDVKEIEDYEKKGLNREDACDIVKMQYLKRNKVSLSRTEEKNLQRIEEILAKL